MKKIILCLVALFISQFLASCLSCPDARYFERVYEGFEISPFKLAEIVEDSLYSKKDFGLYLTLLTQQEEVSAPASLSFAGYNSSFATQKCESNFYKYPDQIQSVAIYLQIPNKSDSLVSDLFLMKDNQGNNIEIATLLDSYAQNNDAQQFSNYLGLESIGFPLKNNITFSAERYSFEVVLTLFSNTQLSAKTALITLK